ncbi:hypothetical protein HHL22_04485 [Hymenobacter sp. RP-2-7]|uniref:Uncharacterized protein n=1 Tax=Hymenobacter polaris TaxID=2682546 RepID=A0A7Y0AC53_9BACT|nr:hypothetical protein [Hymenobacter polaris]NML64457.1 hypothetical protein [Hymenobacter polaris]
MNLIEAREIIDNNSDKINYQSRYVSSGAGSSYYEATNLNQLRRGLLNIEQLPYFQDEINSLKESWLFKSKDDTEQVESSLDTKVSNLVYRIKIGIHFLQKAINDNRYSTINDIIYIKLPEIKSFETLSRYSNDLKKAIEIPVVESNKGEVDILTAESGSIWLVVSLGTASAVNLVAGICWAAAVIRKKQAEANIFEQHAKTLELKNNALDILVEAQKIQINNILSNEAEAIANKHFDRKEPETIERLKLSINTISDLIEKGAKIIPSSSDSEANKLFPDYNSLSLIESSIKQIMSNNR